MENAHMVFVYTSIFHSSINLTSIEGPTPTHLSDPSVVEVVPCAGGVMPCVGRVVPSPEPPTVVHHRVQVVQARARALQHVTAQVQAYTRGGGEEGGGEGGERGG